jgi:hypothetical protein
VFLLSLQPHPWPSPISLDEFYPSRFQRSADRGDCAGLQLFAVFQPRDRIRGDLRQLGELSNSKTSSDPGHFALNCIHFEAMNLFCVDVSIIAR